MSSGFGLLLSTIFSDAGVVMALVPVLIIPFLLVGGFFVPLETVFGIYYPFEYLSMFRYGFEAIIYSQYENNKVVLNGVSYDVMASNYHFQVRIKLCRFRFGWISHSWQSSEQLFGSWPYWSCIRSVTPRSCPFFRLKKSDKWSCALSNNKSQLLHDRMNFIILAF